ncbi:MAG: hypothetical protein HZA54_10600, partial [Planctomycetes bacterium]|nr:hypothetical protein [Planctomycetota bacterium]
GMPAWRQLNNVEEMYAATQIPPDRLHELDTASLVETCLDYPLILNLTASDSLQMGFAALAAKFNGLGELLSRPDAAATLLERYRRMDPEEVVRRGAEFARDEKSRFYVKFVLIELLLAQEKLLAGMSSGERRAVVREALRKYDAKVQHPQQFGFLGLSPCGLAMREALRAEGIAAAPGGGGGGGGRGERGTDVDRDEIDGILTAARAFAGE